MVGQDDMSAVADKQVSIDAYPGCAQAGNFRQECEGIKHNSIPNYAPATGPQHA
jgi:hypothetical protein